MPMNNEVKLSAYDIQKHLAERMNSTFRRKWDQYIREDDDKRNGVLEVVSAAKSFGGEDVDNHNGVIVIYFRHKESAIHFVNYLETSDVVEQYEITAKYQNRSTDTEDDVIDFDSIADDRQYEFQVIVYLYPEYSDFNMDFDGDGDEDEDDMYYLDDMQVESTQIDEATFVVKHDGVGDDHPDADVKKLFKGKKDVVNHITKFKESAVKAKALLDKKGFKNVRIEQNGKMMEAEQIDEVMRKIRITSRGVKSIKMKCSHGFRWDPNIHACVKIEGDELATMRKASRKALITKKSEGASFKIRVKRRIKKAFKFRQMMGLRV